ncbi:muts domain V-domain-containing protein [Hygrophoropsis aurantiaca]|uniref:Muts domain V-domain-containing protein n=1 Tax=Hygrophoropsis aurantiaca TaxID=72124 RepID=A0ACB8A5F7_9AGAM|nr:muts domain V-domain-containing protein [Hygrophoropsis aurantiaca]
MAPFKAPQKTKSNENMKQKSLMNFFGKPAESKTPVQPKNTDISTTMPNADDVPVSKPQFTKALTSSSKSSDAGNSSFGHTPPTSDPIDVDMLSDAEEERPLQKQNTRVKRKIVIEDSDDEGETSATVGTKATYRTSSPEYYDKSSPSRGRTKKARVSTGSSSENDEDPAPSFSSRLTKFRKSPVKTSRKSGSRSVPDDDDFIVPSDSDEAPGPRSSSRASSRSNSSRRTSFSHKSGHSAEQADGSDSDEPSAKKAKGKRAVPKKLAEGGNSTGGGNNLFLTAAEQRAQEKKTEKKAAEDPFSFLLDPKDKDGVRPGEPGYDPRTLFIPKQAWKDFSPFETQLYEEDARIGHTEFDLKLTQRVKMSMVGVPESSFNFWAAKFLGKGYKVGRVDQAETALGAEMRVAANKSKGKGGDTKAKEKIVRRELNKVYTNGTLVDEELLTDEQAGHCISIREEVSAKGESSFGSCVLDSATSQFNLSAFGDDVCLTKLETLIRQLRPKEVIFTKGNLSVATTRMLKAILPAGCLWTSLREVEGFTYEQIIKELNQMFAGDKEDAAMDEDAVLSSAVPQGIRDMAGCKTAMEGLGAMAWYLRQLNIDKDLLSMKNFNVYDPMKKGQNLVLDGQTLAHVEVLVNNEGTDEGSLHQLLSRCITPFGKRLFRIWLCVPLRDVSDINARLDAVQELMGHATFEEAFTDLAKGMPDLERIVSRIHANNCKVKDFMKVLASFKKLTKGLDKLADSSESFESKTILGLLRSAPGLTPHLKNIEARFVLDKETDNLLPVEGKDEIYDGVMEEIKELEGTLDAQLKKFERKVGCSLTWWHSGTGNKEIYLVQTKVDQKNIPDEWVKNSATKAVKRWIVPSLQSTIRSLKEARENRSTAIKEFKGRLYAEFDKDRGVWLRGVRVLAELDCLFSLAKSSSALGEPSCRPQFVEGDAASIEFEELRHPTLSCLKESFIPNDIKLGGEVGRVALLTGPNMGGKSTVMRMTATGIIMAQLGMLVPAKIARLCPVDAILTRMGAYDNMFSNSSTFKVELDECCKILRNATPKSMVILDELGRGTSTYDGMAIAGAVLHQLATHTLPLTFFATHYGSLTDDFAYHPNIRNMHMATLLDDDKQQTQLVFLYKLVEGVASSSFGTHVANLAGVPTDVVKRAEVISTDFAKQFKAKVEDKQKKSLTSKLPLVAQADFTYLLALAMGELKIPDDPYKQEALLKGLKKTVNAYIK